MHKFIIFISVLFIATSSFFCTIRKSNSDDQNLQVLQEKTFQINQVKSLKLDASSGNIEISTWDKNEVFIKIWGNSKAREKVSFAFNNDESGIVINAKTKNNFLGSTLCSIILQMH
jgi:hypothetical protein